MKIGNALTTKITIAEDQLYITVLGIMLSIMHQKRNIISRKNLLNIVRFIDMNAKDVITEIK